MIDFYVLLTPVLMLGIFALLGFVGCDVVFGLDRFDHPPQAPNALTATAGDGNVVVSWDPYPDAVEFHVKRGLMSGNYSDSHRVLPSELPYTDTSVTIGTTYYYVVTVTVGDGGESSNSNEDSTIPFGSFVTTTVPGTLRNDFDGWVGMVVQIGANPLTVLALGRIVAAGNSSTHAVKIVDASTGAEVPGASVSVNLAGGVAGKFAYTKLPSEITLSPNASYYILTQEILGGDFFYDLDSTIQTRNEGNVTQAVYSELTTPNTYNLISSAGHSYGFVDFQYY